MDLWGLSIALKLLYVRVVPNCIAWNRLAHMYVFPNVTVNA